VPHRLRAGGVAVEDRPHPRHQPPTLRIVLAAPAQG
jgi:hypothetical protein